MDKRLQNEIEHGKYLAQHGAGEIWNWTSPAGRKRWARRVEMLSAHIRPPMRVLEIGCGTGYFTRELINTNAEITAIDISSDLLNIAINDITSPNVEFIVENAYQMRFADNTFDSIIGSSVLHHLDINRALSEFFRVLKPGGSICFTEPNMLNPQIAVQKNIPLIKKYMGDSPDETAFFRWPLKKKLEKTGFKNIQIRPFDFLHPKTPVFLIPFLEKTGQVAETMPVIREIAGSVYIRANK